MKILLLSNVFPPGFIGGYELGALDVARHLVKRGHQVTVLTSDYFLDDEGEIDDLDVRRILDWSTMSHDLQSSAKSYTSLIVWRNLRAILSEIRKFDPDAVMCFNIAALGQFAIAAMLRHLRVPTVYYFMDVIFEWPPMDDPWLAKFQEVFGPNDLGENASAVFMSRNLHRQVLPRIGSVLDQTYFVPGWIPDSVFDVTRTPSLSNDGRRFVFSSRVAPHKGTELMIEAVKMLSSEGVPQFSVDVYGSGQVTSFVQRCVSRGVDHLITYKGTLEKDEMLKRFYNYDALLFPTWAREPYGFVASEAAATGCIPIMTQGIGASEWFLDEIDSFKIAPTAESLANAMRKVILMKAEELEVISSNSISNAKNNLRMSYWMNEVEEIVMRQAGKGQDYRKSDSYGIQSSLLVLMELWKERCGIG